MYDFLSFFTNHSFFYLFVVLALKLECLVTAGVVLNPEELVGFEEEEVEEEILLLVLLGSKIPLLVLSALEKVDLLSIDGV